MAKPFLAALACALVFLPRRAAGAALPSGDGAVPVGGSNATGFDEPSLSLGGGYHYQLSSSRPLAAAGTTTSHQSARDQQQPKKRQRRGDAPPGPDEDPDGLTVFDSLADVPTARLLWRAMRTQAQCYTSNRPALAAIRRQQQQQQQQRAQAPEAEDRSSSSMIGASIFNNLRRRSRTSSTGTSTSNSNSIRSSSRSSSSSSGGGSGSSRSVVEEDNCWTAYVCGHRCEPVLLAVRSFCRADTPYADGTPRWTRCAKARKFNRCFARVCFRRTGPATDNAGPRPASYEDPLSVAIVRYSRPPPKHEILARKNRQSSTQSAIFK